MDINFDFRSFQDEITNKLSQCISESFEDEDTDMQDVSDDIDEANISYKKIQKILNTPEMEKCHPWLYSLDMENLNEDEAKKVDKIYDLGVKRGVIQEEDETDNTEDVNECGDDLGDSDQICGGPDDALTNQEMTPQETEPASSDSSFTVLYSAIKDGKIKTGEYYSNALDNEGAKEDCISNLTQVGYSAIRVLGIEKTNTAVDTHVDNVEPDVDMYDGLEEDDSEEFEKQETGDIDTTDDKETDVNSNEKKEDVMDDKTEDTEKKEEKTDDEEVKDDSDKEEQKDNVEQKDDEDTEDTEDDSDDEEKDEKLSNEEKKALKDDYTSTFRSILFDMKLEKSVEEMTLSEKNDFYSKLAKKWIKNDPSEFMTDKEQEKLNKIVIKK